MEQAMKGYPYIITFNRPVKDIYMELTGEAINSSRSDATYWTEKAAQYSSPTALCFRRKPLRDHVEAIARRNGWI
jgi:hypothetical protein